MILYSFSQRSFLLLTRKSKIELHPDISKIIAQVSNKIITKRAAAKIVGTSEQNFNQWYNRRYKHVPKDKKKPRKKRPVSPKDAAEPALLIRLAGDQTNEEWGAAAWKNNLQSLTLELQRDDLEVEGRVKLSNTLIKLLSFQFKEKSIIPEYQEQELKLNKAQEEELVNRILKDHDEWCPYCREAVKEQTRKQADVRFLSSESP